jgi:hypothetical protein
MEIKFVKRSIIQTRKKKSSKFRPLVEAIQKLKPHGQAIEVTYSNEKEVNSMRTAVYQFCRQKDFTVKSRKDSVGKKIFFYRDK